jgi:hypothetical protein
MREHGFLCRTVAVSIRDNELFRFRAPVQAEPAVAYFREIADRPCGFLRRATAGRAPSAASACAVPT